MITDSESITKVLALFDSEDIPYIKATVVTALEDEKCEDPFTLKLGVQNDGQRK